MIKIDKLLGLMFESSLSDIKENNSSFDSAVLRICYSGLNRNGSYISKDSLEKCIKSIYNCPIVCNYNRDEDSLGGHDVEIVKDGDEFKLVNLTQPVGVIPESANVWFDEFEEEDGTKHEYLYSDVLLWKRQEAYQKIIKDGIVNHSMEITVKDGKMVDGIYNIYDFEFTAFALIGCEPCFEGSALETFSNDNFKREYYEMLSALKNEYSKVITSQEDHDIHPQSIISKEGGSDLDKNFDLSNTDESKVEEIVEPIDIETVPTDVEKTDNEEAVEECEFTLNSNIVNELRDVVRTETIKDVFGEYPKYHYIDYSMDKREVYVEDCADWKLYSFTFEINGDSVSVDFESKKRVKYEIIDFEGDDEPVINATFSEVLSKASEYYEYYNKYNDCIEKMDSLENEIEELRKFKAETEAGIIAKEKEDMLNNFSDLVGIEAYDTLVNNNSDLSVEELEEKCFAIRGRNTIVNFSKEAKTPKIIVERNEVSDEPYGGLFTKYGFDK